MFAHTVKTLVQLSSWFQQYALHYSFQSITSHLSHSNIKLIVLTFNLLFLLHLNAQRWAKASCFHPSYQMKIEELVDTSTGFLQPPGIVVEVCTGQKEHGTHPVYPLST